MKILKSVLTAAACAVAFTGTAQELPKLKILEVAGSGDACLIDEEGAPIDWAVTIDEEALSFHASFYSFYVDAKDKSDSCRLKIKVAKPQGYTFAVREPHIVGQANIHQDEYAKLHTMLQISGKTYPIQDQLKIKSGVEAWETGGETYLGSYAPPCDAEEITMNIEMSLGVFGNDSAAKINSATFSDKSYTMKKCD